MPPAPALTVSVKLLSAITQGFCGTTGESTTGGVINRNSASWLVTVPAALVTRAR